MISYSCQNLHAKILFNIAAKYFKVCDRNAIDVNDCLVEAVQKGIAAMVNGIEELGVPPIDPYLQKDFRIEYKNNQVCRNYFLGNVLYSNNNILLFTMEEP